MKESRKEKFSITLEQEKVGKNSSSRQLKMMIIHVCGGGGVA
jgi:hypothetical protein